MQPVLSSPVFHDHICFDRPNEIGRQAAIDLDDAQPNGDHRRIQRAHHAGFRPVLALNADFRPLSYHPLSLWSWQDAVKAVFLDRVSVISEYDDITLRSPGLEIKQPSVIALKSYVSPAPHAPFTRYNVFLRDHFRCQYCGTRGPTEKLTFDHVVPRVQGGKTEWGNIVAACSPCNLKKGGRNPKEADMQLRRAPWRPTTFDLNEAGRKFPPRFLHESWRDFLYWDTELEP